MAVKPYQPTHAHGALIRAYGSITGKFLGKVINGKKEALSAIRIYKHFPTDSDSLSLSLSSLEYEASLLHSRVLSGFLNLLQRYST